MPPAEIPDSVFSDVSSSKILGKFHQLTPFVAVICLGQDKSSDRNVGRATNVKHFCAIIAMVG